jgi:uncharacterized protein (DUF2237 family)
MRWKEAFDEGVYVPVDLKATNILALEYIRFTDLTEPPK